MAEYIDRDALFKYYRALANIEWNKTVAPISWSDAYEEIADHIAELPTADVVPKSEVDVLIGKLECFLCHATGGRLSKHTYDLRTMETVATDCINETYNDGFGEGYKECAREIFEEIESIIAKSRYQQATPFGAEERYNPYVIIKQIAELKKKYTEGEANAE